MSIRRGLPHLYSTTTPKGNLTPSLNLEQFYALTSGGTVHLANLTEKTDGATFLIGYDRVGFFTQYSGSGTERARVGSDHISRAKRRANERGVEFNSRVSYAMAEFHRGLESNDALVDYLKSTYEECGEIGIRGEIFNKLLGTKSLFSDEMKFIHTSYSTKNMGTLGSFILHSELEDNKCIDPNTFIQLANSDVSFDHDKVQVNPQQVNVESELDQLLAILRDKTHEAFNEIKKKVSEKVTSTIAQMGIKNKWGSGTEGLVVHPSSFNPQAPRFKVTSREFQKAKAESVNYGW